MAHQKKPLLHRRVDDSIDTSVQFMGYSWCKVRISRDKGYFAGRTGERDNSIIMGYSGSTSLVFSCIIVVPDGFGYSTALVFEREKKGGRCIKVLGKVVYTEKGYVIYTTFKHNDTC